jgi:glyoxylase-like metal-dependent hydrolase (beta-lactamase superfamily II)
MHLYSINTGQFKLDGGAMFGVVPKTIWNKTNPADANNMIDLAMRCLLVEDGNRLILIDNGIGNKQDDKFFGHYYLNGDDTLQKSLHKLGFDLKDITDMLLSHLHFDHCGGSISWNSDRTKFETTFPNATYWVHADHWHEANHPNAREKASFLKENILPIQESGQLKLFRTGDKIHDKIDFITGNGHTRSMVHPKIQWQDKTVVFMADMIPTINHLPIPYVMGYDVRPLDAMQEKSDFLQEAAANNYILFFEHDAVNEACTVAVTEKGIRKQDVFHLSEL